MPPSLMPSADMLWVSPEFSRSQAFVSLSSGSRSDDRDRADNRPTTTAMATVSRETLMRELRGMPPTGSQREAQELSEDEEDWEDRKEDIRMFGHHWLRPIGVNFTALEKDTDQEDEEGRAYVSIDDEGGPVDPSFGFEQHHPAQARADAAAAVAAEAARRGYAPRGANEEGYSYDDVEVDLDASILDRDADLDVDMEAEEEEERDLDASIEDRD